MNGSLNSDSTEVKPSSSKRPRMQDNSQEGDGGLSEEFVQDQVIIVPEVMSKILEHLDLRSLKNCRLACKSWLQEVQAHFVQRSVVRFKRKDCTPRIKSFKETRQKELVQSFPQPFHAIVVDLCILRGAKNLPHKLFFKLLPTILCPTIVLTRFSPSDVPLKLALPVIIQCSSSLEYLKLRADSCEVGYLPTMDPQQNFPKLKFVQTEITAIGQENDAGGNHFASIVAWIVNASPNFETWDSLWGVLAVELGSQLMLKLNIENVKTLHLSGHRLTRAASKHFLSIPFRRLEHLKLHNVSSEISPKWEFHASVETVRKSAGSLKNLLLDVYIPTGLRPVPKLSMVCPNVTLLTLGNLNDWKRAISTSFPSLRVLNARRVDLNLLGGFWRNMPPFSDITTLRASCYPKGGNIDEKVIRFLEKFVDLKRIRLDTETLLTCCRLHATGVSRLSNIFDRVKHLELFTGLQHSPFDLSPIVSLRGVETITVLYFASGIGRIPFRNMPSLKMIEFPWSKGLDLGELLEMARAVDRVVVTNCCYDTRLGDQHTKELLNKFFDSAYNVECGCRKNRR